MPPEDYIDIEGLRNLESEDERNSNEGRRRKFLSVWYQCCHTYGRMIRNASGTKYIGHCPRCGARVEALIGPGGTSQRIFKTR